MSVSAKGRYIARELPVPDHGLSWGVYDTRTNKFVAAYAYQEAAQRDAGIMSAAYVRAIREEE